jgi:hypothetical protein
MRFHNLSAYKAYATSFLIRKINETSDERIKMLLQELVNRIELLRTRDFYRFLARIYEVQKQTGVDLSLIIPDPEEVQQIMQYPA